MEKEHRPAFIAKTLKFGNFIYDEERDLIIATLNDKDGNITGRIELNKTYSYALLRFIVRISQRNWFRRKAVIKK